MMIAPSVLRIKCMVYAHSLVGYDIAVNPPPNLDETSQCPLGHPNSLCKGASTSGRCGS